MTPREGTPCRWCGYPVDVPAEHDLCVTCREWDAGLGDSSAAVAYAAREGEKARQKRWEARRK